MAKDITVDLEAMIDAHGLLHVLVGLELVCIEKAVHIRANWQDRTTAKAWDADARTIATTFNRIKSEGLAP